MADLLRGQGAGQLWLTRQHLMAAGVMTLSIAVLSFFLGLKVGRLTAPDAAAQESAGLLPDTQKQESLQAVLREVEASQPARDYQFPSVLPADGAAAPTVEEPGAGAASEAPAGEAPDAPESAAAGKVPAAGWAVQVASYQKAEDADARVEALTAEGHHAYRVAALAEGETWYRVRIGGFSSEAEAGKALPDLQEALGGELVVARAP